MVQTQLNSFSISDDELNSKNNGKNVEFKYRVMKIFVGQFENHEYDLAQHPTIYVPEDSDLIYYSPDYKSYDEILKNNSKYNTLKNQEKELYMILSFPTANDYIIKVNKTQEDNLTKGDVTINRFKVAVFSNPFLGFLPDSESLRSSFLGNRFYHVRNYDGTPYVVNYKIDFSKLAVVSIFFS